MSGLSLKQKLALIEQVFDLDDILSLQPDKAYIQKYYKLNKLPYTLVHSKSGLLHLAISRDGTYKEDDLYESVRFVDRYILKQNAKNVLELATGRGSNSAWLARQHPDINFYGIDLSDTQLGFAKKSAKKVKNYIPAKGDFHQLKHYGASKFEVVFVIESFCYSQNKAKVFNEVRRVLKPGGVFIVVDAYAKKSRGTLSATEQKVCKLLSLGMAAEDFDYYSDFVITAQEAGFRKIFDEDVSRYLLPNLYRLEKISYAFLRRKRLTYSTKLFLPKIITYNAISGFLMPDVINQGLDSYWISVFKKGSA